MNTNGIGYAYAQAAAQSASTSNTAKVNKTNGQKEIGNPKLSEKAQKYYDQLKKKFSNMDFVEKYEKVLRGATTQFPQMKKDLGSNADVVKTFGMKVNDNGTASFFAVIDKSLAAQKKRLEEKAAQRKEDKKKAEKEEKKDKAEEKRVDGLKDKGDADSDTVTVTASSWEELLQKINEAVGNSSGDSVRTKEETWVGQQFDYTI